MDDLLAISKTILDKVPRLQALDNYFRTPEILARQQRVDQLEELAQQNAKRFREDTAGKIDIRPFRTLVLEQSKLEEEIEKDKARFLQQLLDDWGTVPDGLRALTASTSQAPRDPHPADSIPTPSRAPLPTHSIPTPPAPKAPLPASSIPTPSRSSVVHDNLETAGPGRDATAESQALLADNAERIPSRKPRTSASRRRSSNISLDENRPVKRSRRGQITPSLTPDRFIKFSDVFQGGDAPAKYRIVQFPFRQGNWYILECKDCDIQFQGEAVVEDAYDHFYHNHGRSFSTTEEQVVQVLGTHVSDCNAELAEKNNALCPLPQDPDGDETELETEDEGPEEPSERRKHASTRKKKGKRGRRKNPNAHWVPPKSFKDIDPRIINAKPGDIVCLYNDRTRFFSPLMILPWGPFPRLNFEKVLQDVELQTTIPKCYDGAKPTDLTPPPWAPGYEDDGELAHKRSLPGLFFRAAQDFPHECRSGWVPLSKLKVYDKTCPRTRNKESVEEYIEYYAEWCNDPQAKGTLNEATASKRSHRFQPGGHRGPENSTRDQSVTLSTVQSSRQSTEQFSVAPTIEDVGIKEEPEVNYEQTEDDDGEKIEGREEEGGKQCDEQRPQCSRCLDKDIPCEYPRPKSRALRSPTQQDNSWSQLQSLTIPTPHYDARSTSASLSTSDLSPGLSPYLAPSPNFTLLPQEIPLPSVDLGAAELELFSYYLSHTARSLAYDEDDLYALQVGFPNLAFRSKPLMSSILALAAVRKCHDLISQPLQRVDKSQVRHLLALADEHHRVSLRQTRADIPIANHYDHVVANAPLMVLYATANHAVRIKVAKALDEGERTSLAPVQLHWMTLIRAAHLAYTGLLHSTKDFGFLEDFTASPPDITLNSQSTNGLVPLGENGPTPQTEQLLMPIIAATSGSALEKLRTRAQALEFAAHLKPSWESPGDDTELQACLVALEALNSIVNELFHPDQSTYADSQQPDLEAGWAALSQLSDVSPWLRSYLARVTFSTPPKPFRRTIMWFLNRIPSEFLSIVESVLDNIPTSPDSIPDEGIQCEGDISETTRLAMDIFSHWLVLVMLLDGVWWIGGIGTWSQS
ncbi:C6 transcription factor [Fusarium mundagurra]|uniref:C6 transcription factor n=1 Tax=Fusarium mundagurra TaxID=1567541 RepID=A0A8H6DMX6_9HYPO|nr:C6 transcription factor [Fusarium mundagurra]